MTLAFLMFATWADAIPDWVVFAVLGTPVVLVILSLYLIFPGLPNDNDSQEGDKEE